MEERRTSDTEPLSYAFDWRPEEHGRVIRRLVRERQRAPLIRALRLAIWALLVLAAIVAWAAWTSDVPGDALLLTVLIVLVGGLLAAFPWLVAWLRVWMTRRTDPNVADPLRYTLDPSGVRLEGRTADTTLRWDGLDRVREDDEFFFFYYSRWLAYYLPKRVVDRPDVLRAAIRRWLPDDIPFEEV